jgi:glycosyltransferase involved in cell wall biosynthesis
MTVLTRAADAGGAQAAVPVPTGPKTILYVDHTAKMSGGEIALFNLIGALDRSLYTPVVVLASDGALGEKLREKGVETHVLPIDARVLETRKDSIGVGSLLRLSLLVTCCRYAFRLAKWARSRRVDLIHTNSLKSDIYGGMAGRLARIPVLWHVRDNIDGEYLPARVASAFRLLARCIPNYVVANSESTLRRLRLGLDREASVVYSGISGAVVARHVVHDGYSPGDSGVEPAVPEPGGPDVEAYSGGAMLFIMVGRIAEWKGQHIFLQAAAKVRETHPRARFQIVGGPLFGEHAYEASLYKLAKELNLGDSVEFLGFRDDVPALIAQAQVLVHASTLGEPFGQVVIEGMAAGKPVIATDGGGLPEIVIPGGTGLLVPMGDANAMADAMREMLDHPARAVRMGQAGIRRVEERFTIARTARTVESVYARVLAKAA